MCGIVVLCVLVCVGGSIWFRWCISWFRLLCPKLGSVRRSSVVYSANWCQCVMCALVRQLRTLVGRFTSIGLGWYNHSYVYPKGPSKWFVASLRMFFIRVSLM